MPTPADTPAVRQPNYRALAFYLPQYHPIPENDEWWGPGFTEWTNTVKARPLFPGHRQPNLPADIGFYDLRVPEVREQQARLAREAGIEGFCYWHYWFAGRRILERPFSEVLTSGKPEFPFCLAWANESWQGVWHGCERRTLIEQTYPGDADYVAHFRSLLPAFHDPRYVRVDDCPVFVVYQPAQLPAARHFVELWQRLARENGLPGLHLVAHVIFNQSDFDWRAAGFSAALAAHSLKVIRTRAWNVVGAHRARLGTAAALRAAVRLTAFRTAQRLRRWPGSIFRYEDAALFMNPPETAQEGWYPTAVPNWDNSPRAGRRGVILHQSSPESYRVHLLDVLSRLTDRPRERRLVFIKSWNEWAEGNYLEPDRRFGHQYLRVTGEALFSAGSPTDERSPVKPGLRQLFP
jgi:lipopolysaccharide biosynthesis protein